MSASEKLRALDVRIAEADAAALLSGWEGGHCCEMADAILDAYESLALPQIVAVVEAAECQGSGVSMIRALGFVGNAHYCPDCMNHFHDSCGQHEPGCSVLAGMLEDDEWPDLAPLTALASLDAALGES